VAIRTWPQDPRSLGSSATRERACIAPSRPSTTDFPAAARTSLEPACAASSQPASMGGRKLALRQLCQVARTQLRPFTTAQPALASGFEGREGEPVPAVKAPEGPNGVIKASDSLLQPTQCCTKLSKVNSGHCK